MRIFIEAVMEDPSSPSTYLPANHSVDFEVEVETMDGTAKGEYCHSVCYYPGVCTNWECVLSKSVY